MMIFARLALTPGFRRQMKERLGAPQRYLVGSGPRPGADEGRSFVSQAS
jgi:hypothetical protein